MPPYETVVWQLDTPYYDAHEDQPAVLITHLKLARLDFEVAREGPFVEKPGHMRFFLAPTYQVDGDWIEPPVQGKIFRRSAEEYEMFMAGGFERMEVNSFRDVESLFYTILAETNRIPPGQIVEYLPARR